MLFTLFMSFTLIAVVGSLLYYRTLIKPPPRNELIILFKNNKDLPSMLSRLPSILANAIFKSQGKNCNGFHAFPQISISIGPSLIDPKHVSAYKSVCCLKEKENCENEVAPICYPVVNIFRFQPLVFSLPCFPFSPFGIVYIRTSICQNHPILVGSKIKYTTSVKNARETERGWEIDFNVCALTENGDTVWKCVQTMLSRKRQQKVQRKSHHKDHSDECLKTQNSAIFSVPANIGLKYAAVTGDYNPHHICRLGAIMFGFPRKIAHGQWSLESCLGQLQKSTGIVIQPPYKVECAFKLPVFLPSDVRLIWSKKDNTTDFSLWSADGKLPHLTASLETRNVPYF
ncbi:3-hydroxyacyl-thioester dehydratase X-like [Schistocerca gregaria]|uniref:3-hydroxyacyl-thioester dehydratase X-like n=1 Tax=Schistocerca gregaria TaxID=7010 RepID=UPI00211E1F9E|nr:3-hydroxyacyl-thioester dehydratase X-like [Schistocerca gregaria]